MSTPRPPSTQGTRPTPARPAPATDLQPGLLDGLRSIKTRFAVVLVGAVLATGALMALGNGGGVAWPLTVLVALGGGLLVTQILAGGLVAPLRRMTQVARQMSAGDLSGRVPVPLTRDEVSDLAIAFNTMADDLARVDAERRDLVATVSHELRTPLTAMTAVLENLADGVVDPDTHHLGQALGQAERLRDLVADLLELSRLEIGTVGVNRTVVRLSQVIERAVADVDTGTRAVQVITQVPRDLFVEVDEARLEQLLRNTLENAIRHSPEGEQVRVIAGALNGATASHPAGPTPGWWLEIADRGPGVAPDRRERVFERFGTEPGGGGTGLGLAISRWVARLHGGSLQFLDPTDGTGARLRLQVGAPRPPAALPATPAVAGTPGRWWPDSPRPASRAVVLATVGVAILGGVALSAASLGLGWFLTMAAAGGVAWATSQRRSSWYSLVSAGLAALLLLPGLLYANDGYVLLGTLAAAVVYLVSTTAASTVQGFLATGFAWIAAPFTGLSWFSRALRPRGPVVNLGAVVRTGALLVLALLVFGALLGSADAVFGRWLSALVPEVELNEWVVRAFVGCLVFGVTLAGVYLGVNPPRVEGRISLSLRARHRWEWLVPLTGVVVMFLGFVLAQVTALFGGEAYLQRTAGLTYAEYVHQGFAQMVVATVLTLAVMSIAAATAPARDRSLLRTMLGLLGVLALVVAVSALIRMEAYADAYGFTVLRLFVTVFEVWVVVMLLAVLACGAFGRAAWLPRVGLLVGASLMAALLLVNPSAWVASHNIARYDETGDLDVEYLTSISQDAATVIADELPAPVARCILFEYTWTPVGQGTGWREWTWGAHSFEKVRAELGPPTASCSGFAWDEQVG